MADSNEPEYPEVVHSFKLKGHKKAVLCLAAAENVDTLWSGSEDATCRLFDLRTQRRTAVLGILAGDAVMSIQLHSQQPLLHVAAGNEVKLFDIRQPSLPLLRDGRCILKAEDEINQILICEEDSNMLLAGDDAGHVYTVDHCFETGSEPNTLSHDLAAMVTSIACVVPPYQAPIILSGGTDCTVVAWQENSRLSSVHIPNSSTNANQICNPPMVHTMAVLPAQNDSFRFLTGLGDGSLGILSLSIAEKRLELLSRVEDVPSDAVAISNNRIGSAGNGLIASWEHQDNGMLRQSLVIDHLRKVNAIEWGDTTNTTLFVGDTTPDITCFKTPFL